MSEMWMVIFRIVMGLLVGYAMARYYDNEDD